MTSPGDPPLLYRFVFFHAFFTSKKPSSDLPEANAELSAPLDDRTRAVLVNSFFG